MTQALAAGALRPAARSATHRAGGGPSLEQIVSGAWEGLAAGRPVACPVCRADLQPRRAQGHLHGECPRCGSQLS